MIRRTDGERGTMSLEMVIATPIFVAFLLLLVGIGRIVDAESQVDGAARDGARAASIARFRDGPDGASAAAEQAARASLGNVHWCLHGGPTVTTDVQDWGSGGAVTVHVSCDVSLADVAWVGFGSVTKVGTATAPIDQYTYRNEGSG